MLSLYRICIHLPACTDIEDEFYPATVSLTLAPEGEGINHFCFIPPRAYARGYAHAAPLALKSCTCLPVLQTGK